MQDLSGQKPETEGGILFYISRYQRRNPNLYQRISEKDDPCCHYPHCHGCQFWRAKCDLLQWSGDNWSQRGHLEVITWQRPGPHLIISLLHLPPYYVTLLPAGKQLISLDCVSYTTTLYDKGGVSAMQGHAHV